MTKGAKARGGLTAMAARCAAVEESLSSKIELKVREGHECS